MNKPILFEKPQGVRDYLPGVAIRKREIERKISDCYASWGYQEVITPTFEYMDTFQNGLRGEEDRVFKLMERSGKTVVLRPDMTTPIARVVASLLREEPLPLRLSYNASIFRQQEFVAGRDAEFTQAGVELVGDGSSDADAELIALAVTTLRFVGLDEFRLALGQVGFVNGILSEYVADHSLADRMRMVLADKNYVGFEHLVAQIEDSRCRDVLLRIPQLRGGLEVLQEARTLTTHETTLAALGNLEEIWHILSLYGVEKYVQIDLGLLLGLNYYTGAIFEGYAPQIGFPLCGGGRYDDLLEKFGRPAPATGFMIGLERVLEVLERKGGEKEDSRYLVLYSPSDRRAALEFTNDLRKQGYTVTAQRHTAEGVKVERGMIVCHFDNGNLVTEDETLRAHFAAFQRKTK